VEPPGPGAGANRDEDFDDAEAASPSGGEVSVRAGHAARRTPCVLARGRPGLRRMPARLRNTRTGDVPASRRAIAGPGMSIRQPAVHVGDPSHHHARNTMHKRTLSFLLIAVLCGFGVSRARADQNPSAPQATPHDDVQVTVTGKGRLGIVAL